MAAGCERRQERTKLCSRYRWFPSTARAQFLPDSELFGHESAESLALGMPGCCVVVRTRFRPVCNHELSALSLSTMRCVAMAAWEEQGE